MNIVISGTSRGIGLAIAEKFCSGGHEVFGFDCQAAALELPLYHHIIHDIRDELSPNALDIPDPNILINCAGTQDDEHAIEVNLEGTIRFTEYFLKRPSLRSIVFIASASARNGSEFPRYVASKAGIIGYMKNLALTQAARGICCNSISPGGVITPLNQHIIDSDELYAQVLNETLLGKWAEAAEIADLAWYLSVENRSITGEDILIDNGEQLKSNFIW